MGLNATDIDAIEALLAPGNPADGVGAVRRQFPHLSITRCDPSDMDAEASFRTWPHLSLYLVDGSGHCWRLTGDPARATGIVLVPTRPAS